MEGKYEETDQIKRGFAALLALTLALGMSISAFAIEGTADTGTAVAKKDYQVINKDKAFPESPEETFTFTATAKEVTDATNEKGDPLTVADMPSLTITVDKYNEGEAGSTNSKKDLRVTPNKPFPSVGIYTYTVTETVGNTAGVAYSKDPMELKVTVFHDAETGKIKVAYAFKVDGTKGADIVNTYSAGSLYVTKTVTGNLGNKTQKFNFTVTFTAPDNQTVKSTIKYGDNQTITPADFENEKHTATVRISLADGEQEIFKNVPYGVTYTVVEDTYDGYETIYGSDKQGTIEKAQTIVHIQNDKKGEVLTGVILHSAPYVLLLVGVGAAAVAFLILKTHRDV